MFELPKLDRLLAADDFEPLVGQTFLAHCDPEPAPIQLVQVRRTGAKVTFTRAPFILVFRSLPTMLLLAGAYAMKCGEFGPESVYIAPTISPPGQQLYQAVFD